MKTNHFIFTFFIASVLGQIACVDASAQQATRRGYKWRCRAYGHLHNSPSECSKPTLGGIWVPDPNAPATPDRYDDTRISSDARINAATASETTWTPQGLPCTEYVTEVLKDAGFDVK